jgi:hypothetical protein
VQFKVRGAPSGRITRLSVWVTEFPLVLPEIIKVLLLKNIATQTVLGRKGYQYLE